MRNTMAGDCFFNVGVLMKSQGKVGEAVEMLELAISLDEEEHGKNAHKVAEIYECLAYIHSENTNFSAAMRSLENSLQIRANNMAIEGELPIKQEIRDLYDNIKIHIESGALQDSLPDMQSKLK